MSSLLVRAVLKCPSDMQMCWSNRCPKVPLDSTPLEEEEEEELLISSSTSNKHETAFTMRNFFDSYPIFICTNTWCGKGLHFSLIWKISFLADQSILHEKCALTSSSQLISPFRCLNEKLIAVIVCSLPSQRVLVNAWDLFSSIILSQFKHAFSLNGVCKILILKRAKQNRKGQEKGKRRVECCWPHEQLVSQSQVLFWRVLKAEMTPPPLLFLT